MILLILKRVYTTEGDTTGKSNNKRRRISSLKNSTSSRTLFQSPGTSPKPRCKSTKIFTNIKYSMTTLKHCIKVIIKVTVTCTLMLFCQGEFLAIGIRGWGLQPIQSVFSWAEFCFKKLLGNCFKIYFN